MACNLSNEGSLTQTVTHTGRRKHVLSRLAPYALALMFALWGLRGISNTNLYSDAPNHLMNGALLADLIRSGEFTSPLQYAKNYYSRLPATTIPFHPPMFPAFESLFFLAF